jgi:hypothetical protein
MADPIAEAVERLLALMASGPDGHAWYPTPGEPE